MSASESARRKRERDAKRLASFAQRIIEAEETLRSLRHELERGFREGLHVCPCGRLGCPERRYRTSAAVERMRSAQRELAAVGYIVRELEEGSKVKQCASKVKVNK